MDDAGEPLSVMDILAAGVAALASVALVLSPLLVAPSMEAAYRGFTTELPLATRLALAWWPSPALGALIAALLVLAVRSRDLLRRRLVLAAGALAGCLFVIALVWALYLPVFALAGRIGS